MTSAESASPLTRSSALLELGRPREALAVLREALLRDPDDPALLVRVVDLLVDLNEGPEALRMARRAVAADPGWAWTQVVLARAYRRLGQHGEALAAAREALRLEPDLPAAHFERGLSALLLADTTPPRRRDPAWLPGARESAGQLEALSPGDGDGAALHAYASLLGARRDWGQFDAEIARALAQNPGHALAHNLRLLGLGRRRGTAAIPELHARLRAHPADPFARRWLRQLLTGRGTPWSRLGGLAFAVALGWLTLRAGVRLGGVGALGTLLAGLGLGWGWRSLPVRLRYREAYRAAYTLPERQARARAALVAGLVGLGGLLLLGLSAFPLAFTPGTLVGLPLLALVSAAVLVRSVPAFLSGEGGFFGRRGEAPPRPGALPRVWEKVIVWLNLAALVVCAQVLLPILASVLSDLFARPEPGTGITAALLLALVAVLAVFGARFVHEAIHGEKPRWRRSPLDGLAAGVAGAVLLGVLAQVPGLPRAWREAHPTVASPAGPLRAWTYGGALAFAVGFAPNEPPGVAHPCDLPENARLVVVRVPGGNGRWALSSPARPAPHPEVTRLSACVHRVGLHPDPRLRVFPRLPGPLRLTPS
ncbi:hypothetical protein DAETH_08050 [Deinococcus aetherius]|uniref:Tetratricopeptide repeat protein n=1 Tax=Deinococcus aetherius TaxID=200252 RepID=A0ABM8AAQ5_9DEIO|nr:tetratricopeptide repeat protein [Deinococcus aetherius]BDP40836.1 hypothetical protein DAETH_08050 [Deinococcus aetherius]